MVTTELTKVYITKDHKKFLTREEAEKHEDKKDHPDIFEGWFYGSKDSTKENK